MGESGTIAATSDRKGEHLVESKAAVAALMLAEQLTFAAWGRLGRHGLR